MNSCVNEEFLHFVSGSHPYLIKYIQTNTNKIKSDDMHYMVFTYSSKLHVHFNRLYTITIFVISKKVQTYCFLCNDTLPPKKRKTKKIYKNCSIKIVTYYLDKSSFSLPTFFFYIMIYLAKSCEHLPQENVRNICSAKN